MFKNQNNTINQFYEWKKKNGCAVAVNTNYVPAMVDTLNDSR